MASSSSPSGPERERRSHEGRWGHAELFDSGYLAVPSLFLREYGQLGLTHGEALLVLQLMDHKWTQAAPFPSYGRLAQRMGISVKMVRRYALGLEKKGCLKREVRFGRTNRFDLTPLFDKLKEIVQPAEDGSPF